MHLPAVSQTVSDLWPLECTCARVHVRGVVHGSQSTRDTVVRRCCNSEQKKKKKGLFFPFVFMLKLNRRKFMLLDLFL